MEKKEVKINEISLKKKKKRKVKINENKRHRKKSCNTHGEHR